MSEFSALPTEIWMLVASYLPTSQLFQVKSLNSFFLNCYMDMTWKYVLIDAEFPVRAIRRLLRVVDPFVATRVKILANCLMVELDTPSKNVSRVMSLLLRSLPLLPNLTCLILELSRKPTRSTFFATFLRTLTSSSLPRRLEKLRIYGHVQMFTSLLDYSVYSSPFENLTVLDLSLSYYNDLGISEKRTSIAQPDLSFTLAPFLRSVAPTLQCLHFSNWSGTLDFFTLLNSLNQSDSSAPFPNLQSLFLSVSMSAIYLPQSSLQSLHHFLVIHSNNLQHLHLTHIFTTADPVVYELLGAWLAKLVDNDIQFPSLQTLQLDPSTTKMGMSALLALIKRTAASLTSLTIPSRYLTCEEIDQLLDALTGEVQTTSIATKAWPSKLKVLDISITHLSVSFFDLLAYRLPQLENLTLSVSDGVVDLDQQDSFYDILRQRRYDRRKKNSSPNSQDILHTWNLRSISIRKYGELHQVVRALAAVVPSVVL